MFGSLISIELSLISFSDSALIGFQVSGVARFMAKFPSSLSSLRRGGCAIKKKPRSILSSRRRGGVQPQQNSVKFDHHPVRSIKEASRYFIEVAATPPQRGGESLTKSTLGNCPERSWLGSYAAPRLKT